MSVKPLQIATVALPTNLLLAPLSGHCDMAFRLVARSCGGLGLGCTDLLSPEGVLRGGRRSMELAATAPDDRPLCMQLYGGDADKMAEAARWAEDHGADVVDINMGCPVQRITQRNGGSALLCDPDNTVRLAEKVRKALRRIPLTAKLRLGWDDTRIVAPQLAARLEDVGVAAITVHGRTTAMRFSGQCRLDGIAAVVAAVRNIPVIGNGDIRSPQDAERMIQQTGCAGVMIGRAALSAPWIFRDTWSYLTTGVVPPPLTIRQKCQLIRDHFHNHVRYRGQRSAVLDMRRRIFWYGRKMRPCRELCERLRFLESPEQFEAALDEFIHWRDQHDANGASAPATRAV